MILCPDCRGPLTSLDATACGTCDWHSDQSADVPVFLSSEDRKREIFLRYVENYDRIAGDDLEHSIQEASFLQFQAERLHGYLGDVGGQSVCDVGLGQGFLFERLREDRPRQLVGVDISMAYLTRPLVDDRVRVVLANAENLPFREEFDVIVAADVAEHVLNISDLLVSVREALVEGGRFAIRVPFKDNMLQYARLNGCRYEMVHLRNFAKDNLVDLLSRSGFKVERLHYDGFALWRARPYLDRLRQTMIRTRAGRRAWHETIECLPVGPDGCLRTSPRLGRLLTTPIAVTAVTQKLS